MDYVITYTKFLKLSDLEKKQIETTFIELYKVKLLHISEISKIMNCSFHTIKQFIKLFNVCRNEEEKKLARIQFCQRKYGVDSPNQLTSIKEKQHPIRTDEELKTILENTKRNNLKKYGVEFTTQRKDVITKIEQTKQEKYGDPKYNNREKFKQTLKDNPEIMKSIVKHMEETMLKKYGVKNISNHYETAKKREIKRKQTMITKYGVDNPMKNKSTFEKVKSTVLSKKGVPYYCMTKECIANSNMHSKINQYFENLLVENNIIFDIEFPICNKLFDFKVGNYLIEIDPTYTHNSTTGALFKNSSSKKDPTNKNYHLEKSKLAQENGFFCIHVFDWDDKHKIINMFKEKKVIYARDCELKEVNKKDYDLFLNLYHLQSSCNGQKICYGLYYKDQLIEIMTFGKPRYNKNYEWELLRLCSHKDYKIVGGSEKLFKHFIREINPQSIISYCDNSKFSGEVYKRLGFILKSKGGPSCNWSKGKEKITNNLLMQRGYDQLFKTNYGKGTSNKDLMIQNGWREVYDCGQSVYVFKNN
ncbi:MAG: hypothetical protein SPJ27_00265 [Candidatus Onthovivens sp.]|nr:hypothetical protein [Candidatus Onthovivens sp.]